MKMDISIRPKRKLFLIISAIAQGVFVLEKNTYSIFVLFIFVFFAVHLLPGKNYTRISSQAFIAFLLFQFVGLVRFFRRWFDSGKVSLIAEMIKIPSRPLIIITGLILAFLGFIFMLEMAGSFLAGEPYADIEHAYNLDGYRASGKKFILFLLCTLFAFIAITICSESSFLYPTNMDADENCFLTVGKAWMNGILPYRDILEHKGPILYLIYGITWLFARDSFFGIYLFEILCASAFLYLMSVICKLYGRSLYIIIPLVALIVYTARPFKTGGNAEELCMPLLAYALYKGLAFLLQRRRISWLHYALIGLSIGIVFWIKYTFVGFYLGWFLFFGHHFIKNKEWKSFLVMTIGLAAGFCIVLLPVVLYFRANNALGDLVEVYFIDNIFLYSGFQGNSLIFNLLLNYGRGLTLLVDGNFLIMFIIILGLLQDKTRFLLTTFGFLFCTTFIGKQIYPYYPFIFTPFICGGLFLIADKVAGINKYFVKYTLPAVCVFMLLCGIMTPNNRKIGVKRETLPQYQFAEVITKSENPTLLNYGFLDAGFYLASGTLPNCKAFCRLNAPIPEMQQLQDEYLLDGKCEYVVTKSPVDVPFYDLIMIKDKYYLYQRSPEMLKEKG